MFNSISGDVHSFTATFVPQDDPGARLVRSVEDDLAAEAANTRLAADRGDAAAQCTLGDMYAQGVGVEHDDAQAVRLYRLAAEAGHIAGRSMVLGSCTNEDEASNATTPKQLDSTILPQKRGCGGAELSWVQVRGTVPSWAHVRTRTRR